MLEFKNMRQRVEFAFENLNVDIIYCGAYRYTVEDHISSQVFENLEEEQMDSLLTDLWRSHQVAV